MTETKVVDTLKGTSKKPVEEVKEEKTEEVKAPKVEPKVEVKEVVKKSPKVEVKEETKTEKVPDTEAKVKVSEPKKDKSRPEAEGVVNIYTSFNNTIVHVTDMAGQTLIKVTGGMVTKHNRLKANPTIAMFIAKRISENLKDKGVKSLYVRIRAKTGNPAPGPGAHAIVKSLSREGFKIANILDTTKMARGGPKKKGGRRGRRP